MRSVVGTRIASAAVSQITASCYCIPRPDDGLQSETSGLALQSVVGTRNAVARCRDLGDRGGGDPRADDGPHSATPRRPARGTGLPARQSRTPAGAAVDSGLATAALW